MTNICSEIPFSPEKEKQDTERAPGLGSLGVSPTFSGQPSGPTQPSRAGFLPGHASLPHALSSKISRFLCCLGFCCLFVFFSGGCLNRKHSLTHMNPVEVTVEERGRQKTKGHSARGEKARVRVYLNLLQKKVPRPSQAPLHGKESFQASRHP